MTSQQEMIKGQRREREKEKKEGTPDARTEMLQDHEEAREQGRFGRRSMGKDSAMSKDSEKQDCYS